LRHQIPRAFAGNKYFCAAYNQRTYACMIPLSIPNLAGNEWQYVKECIETGWISSVGAYVGKFEQMVADFAGAKYGVATVNGTAAIHIALELAGVGEGDLVIVPNITFIASANAVRYTGADPLLIDVDPHTWQMDLHLLEQFLREETYYKRNHCYRKSDHRRIAAILPVHVLGNMCDMDRLLQLAQQNAITVIEDSTEALGSRYKSKNAGTFGLMGTFSFNGNKIISTGGGGVIVTNDENLAKKAKHITNQAKTDPFEYVHDEVGYNYRLVNVLAAIGVAQMEQLPDFITRKKVIDRLYRDGLEGKAGDVVFQRVGEHVDPNCWLHTLKTAHQRPLIQHLLDNGVQCRPFWVPMNRLRMFRGEQYITATDEAGKVYESCISIPSSTNLTDEQVHEVIRVIRGFFEAR
jgi:perosamine synthetase